MRGTYRIKLGAMLACWTILFGGMKVCRGDSAGVTVSADARAAAAPALRVPVLGYVAAGMPPELHPILGFAGAAALGAALDIQPAPTLLAVPPGQTLVLIGRGPSQRLSCAPLGAAGVGPESEIEGSLAGADRAAFSPSGASAVVASSLAGRLQVLTGFPSEPRVAFEIDASGFAANLRSLAVSDNGLSVFAGTSDGVTGSVRLFAKDREPVLLLQAGNPLVVRLSADSAKALVVDPGLNQVTILEGFDAEAKVRVFPASSDGDPAGPDDAVLSNDGKLLYILFARRNEARAVDLENGVMTQFVFGAGRLEAGQLTHGGLSVRTSPDGRSVWLVDFSGPEPLSRYIPSLPPTADGMAREAVK